MSDAIKAKLLDAGATVFARDPFATTADVGQAIGMRKAIVHYYFPEGKAQFLREVYETACETDRATVGLHITALAHARRDPMLAEIVARLCPEFLRVRMPADNATAAE